MHDGILRIPSANAWTRSISERPSHIRPVEASGQRERVYVQWGPAPAGFRPGAKVDSLPKPNLGLISRNRTHPVTSVRSCRYNSTINLLRIWKELCLCPVQVIYRDSRLFPHGQFASSSHRPSATLRRSGTSFRNECFHDCADIANVSAGHFRQSILDGE